jgi:hypothetical protein
LLQAPRRTTPLSAAQAKQAGLDLERLGQRLTERKRALKEEFADGAKLPPPHTRSFTGHELVQDTPVQVSAAPR